MKRNIISIDPNLCNGCGLCVAACHEGALKMVNGKATLISESYCDGLGACLPDCPTGAITIEEREAAPFDQAAVAANTAPAPCGGGCPGTMSRALRPATASTGTAAPAALANWPVQLRLAPVNAPYFNNADLLVAADCTAFASADLHRSFMPGRVTLIGCPKLDPAEGAEKLAAIIRANTIRSVTVLRMEVPCCAGIAQAARAAIAASGKDIPLRTVTISTTGEAIG